MAWLLFPLALFPLAALLTYDWHAIETLSSPAVPTSNWIGPLGDAFAYYGYQILGLSIWIVPLLCLIGGLCLIRGQRLTAGRRELFFLLFLVCVSSVLQVIGSHAGPIALLCEQLNFANAGGAVGYLLMTRLLAPLLNDFGASVLMTVLAIACLVAAIGVHNLGAFVLFICRWALGGLARRSSPAAVESDEAPAAPVDDFKLCGDEIPAALVRETPSFDPIEAARRAKEEARRLREEEKERIRAEKASAKAAAKIAKAPETPPPQPPPTGAPAPAPAPTPAPTDKGPYILPSLALLSPLKKSAADHGDIVEMTQKLIDTLKLFGVDATLAYTIKGPVVTKYALTLAPGTRYSAVTNIEKNLMGALRAKSLRIEAPIPGEECVGIEVPNRAPASISFREIFESDAWRNFKGELPLLFGKDAAGKELIADLASMPHLLVAGATGQGKSVCLNSLINGLLMTKTPNELKLIMVDPKSVEFTAYASIPHLVVPVIVENKKVVFSLQWAVVEMEKRLKLFARAKVRNIYDYNHRPNFTQTELFCDDTPVGSDMPRTVPYVVIIIDEVADLMASSAKEVVPNISRLTAKARAAGIHLILATQRPDAKVITGTIKANIPGRVAFKTATGIDSRTILDEAGAENLIGRGDMLFKSKEGLLIRAQGAWISDAEIANITQFIEQHSNTEFDDKFAKKLSTIRDEVVDIFADPESEQTTAREEREAAKEQVKADAAASDFKKAVECVINTHRASTSHFQRQMGWGYNHAAKILDMLTARGIVSAQQGMGPRQIVMSQDELLAIFNDNAPAGDDAGVSPESSDETQNPTATTDDFTTQEELQP